MDYTIDEEWFWSHVDKKSESECWIYRGAANGGGYTSTNVKNSNRRRRLAHRVAWELANKRAIPAGLVILHSCDVRNCVNPSHLSLGTHSDNLQDCVAKGRHFCPAIKKPDSLRRGERWPTAKLTESAARFIKVALSAGISQCALARVYGVSQGAINSILQGRSWRAA